MDLLSVKKMKQRTKRTSGKASSGSDQRQNGLGEALRCSGSSEGRPAMLLLRFWALAWAGHGGCKREMERGGAALLAGGGGGNAREKGKP